MAGRKPYPDEFRILLEDQVASGSSRRAAGQRLQVSAAMAARWARQKTQTGQAERQVLPRPSRSWGHWKTATFTAGLRRHGLVAPMSSTAP